VNQVSDNYLSHPKALIVAAIKVFFFQESDPICGLKANPNCLANSDGFTSMSFLMMILIIKDGRKQTTLLDCKTVTVKATSFKASKRKDFSFKIKAKSRRPKVTQARLW
jgi:hypothetical protein